jgi:hypothetical protein
MEVWSDLNKVIDTIYGSSNRKKISMHYLRQAVAVWITKHITAPPLLQKWEGSPKKKSNATKI